MNSRIGKYSASMVLVPTSRLELLRLFRPPAPQAGVSTNFTTWARIRNYLPKSNSGTLLRDVLVFRALRGRGFLTARVRGSARSDRRGVFLRGSRGLRLLDAIDHAARFARRIGRDPGEDEAQDEEHRGEHRGGARQEVRRAGRPEEARGGAAAEARAHVGALAVLEQHQADDCQRHYHVYHDDQVGPESHCFYPFTFIF